jgi:hypothetical protein
MEGAVLAKLGQNFQKNFQQQN